MKTPYQQLYEYLTLIIIMGKITTEESATILSLLTLAEKEGYKKGFMDGAIDLYHKGKQEDLAWEAEQERKAEKIQGEGEE